MSVIVTTDGRVMSTRLPSGGRYSVATPDTVALSPGSDGEARRVSLEAIYQGNPTCAAVVNKLCRQISTLPLKVYERDDNGDRRRVRDHPVGELLSRPQPGCSAVALAEWLSQPALIFGNAVLAKYRADPQGPPTSLVPLEWPHLSAYARQGMAVEWWSTTQFGQPRYLDAADAVHVRWAAPGPSGLGISPLAQLALTLRLDDAARRHQEATFRNSARPSGGVTLPEAAAGNIQLRQELRDDLRRLHEGADNAGRPIILPPGSAWESFGASAHDAELMAARQLNREEIAMVYDVPPPMIGDLTRATYANVEELGRQLYVTTLRPWLRLIESTLNRQLIDPEAQWAGVFVEFDTAEVLRGSRSEELDALSKAWTNGFMTLNEVRKALNMPRIDDEAADTPFVAANNMQSIGSGATVDAARAGAPPLT